ncbi:hypothetical protein K438DRAFT_1861762 [Mycena galopus ATCC 62051]|nr:hypothetical protein K438DRAFT_1861762 [Mycena galopus ATCC 62051]
MIHVASLLHDNVINASALSRGVPSAPAAFGNKLAQHGPLAPRQYRGKCRVNVVLCAVCVRASCV